MIGMGTVELDGSRLRTEADVHRELSAGSAGTIGSPTKSGEPRQVSLSVPN